MIDQATARKFINQMPWGRVPKPVLFMMPGECGATRVHLHTTVAKGWHNKVALVGSGRSVAPEGVLGCALEHWIDDVCPPGAERDALFAAVRKLLN